MLRDPTREGPPLRVLVVQDGSSWRGGVAELVTATGAIVLVARSAADALRHADDFTPDVVFVDLSSTAVDAFELGRALSAHARRQSMTLVAFAAPGYEQLGESVRDAGFDAELRGAPQGDDLTRLLQRP